MTDTDTMTDAQLVASVANASIALRDSQPVRQCPTTDVKLYRVVRRHSSSAAKAQYERTVRVDVVSPALIDGRLGGEPADIDGSTFARAASDADFLSSLTQLELVASAVAFVNHHAIGGRHLRDVSAALARLLCVQRGAKIDPAFLGNVTLPEKRSQ